MPKDLNSHFDSLPDATAEDLNQKFDTLPDHNHENLGDKLLTTGKKIGNAALEKVQALGQDTLDTGRGAVQGATLGAAPVIAGAGEATYDKLKSLALGEDGQSWLENYRKHQQESAQNFKEAKERSPWLYGTGELAGTVGTGFLTGGIGAEAKGAMTAAKLGKAALAKQLAKAGVKGASIGGVAGAVGSEGTLTDKDGAFDSTGAQKMGADALGGSAMGAVLGPAGEAAGIVGGKVANRVGNYVKDKMETLAEDSPLIRQARTAYEMGKNRLKLNSGNSSREMQGEIQKSATGSISNQLQSGKDVLGKEIGSALDAADKSGAVLNLQAEAKQALNDVKAGFQKGAIGDMDSAKNTMAVLEKLSSGNNATFTPTGVRSYMPTVQKMIDATEDPQLKASLIGLKAKMEDSLLKAVPDLSKLKGNYSDYMTSTEGLVNGPNKTSWLGDATDPEGKLASGVETLLKKSQSPGSASPKVLTNINDFVNNLNEIESKSPGFLAKIGINPKEMASKMQDAGDQFEMSRSVLGTADPNHDPTHSWWTMFGGANTGRGQIINKANIAGGIVKDISESPVANIGRSLYNMPTEKLTGLAEKLKQSPGTTSIGNYLSKAIDSKNDSLKNAALFSILQNPKARLLIDGNDVK